MSTEILIERIRKKLDALDSNGEQAVALSEKILQLVEAAPPQRNEEKFVGHNITLEEYVTLPLEEKCHYQSEAEERNQQWIDKQLKNLNARWIMVIDSKVVRHGAKLKSFPNHEELLSLCKSTGKYPFAFISPLALAIEEIHTTWHGTKELDDAYPTVSITLYDEHHRFETEADLDTGALQCYAGLELLTANKVVKLHHEDIAWASKHLGQPFFYFALPVSVELIDELGARHQCLTTVLCVVDWWNSSFTAINPARTFLLGREVLLELQPRIVLDFAAKCTEVQFPETTS